jgi:hypothetical protein
LQNSRLLKRLFINDGLGPLINPELLDTTYVYENPYIPNSAHLPEINVFSNPDQIITYSYLKTEIDKVIERYEQLKNIILLGKLKFYRGYYKVSQPSPAGTIIPTINYSVGMKEIQVYWNGVLLKEWDPDVGKGQYKEIGMPGEESTQVELLFALKEGDFFQFIVFNSMTDFPIFIYTDAFENGYQNLPYTKQLEIFYGRGPRTITITGLPDGLHNFANALVEGTPTEHGLFEVTVHVADSSYEDEQVYNFVVHEELRITTPSLGSVSYDTDFYLQMASTGGYGTKSWTATGLPLGLSINSSTGVISGRTTAEGTYTPTIRCSDDYITAERTYSGGSSFIVHGKLVIATDSLPNGNINVPYSFILEGAGGSLPYSWSVSGLPTTMSCSTAGVISGTPVQTTTVNLQITLRDSNGLSAQKNLSFKIANAPIITVSGALPHAVYGTNYSRQIAYTGGLTPLSWNIVSGKLPPGITLNSSSGVISGIPTQKTNPENALPGPYGFTVKVTDADGLESIAALSLTVVSNLSITTSSLPPGNLAEAYSTTLAASGGNQPYTWTASGLPVGYTCSTAGVISGASTALGTYTVKVIVSDMYTWASKTFTLIVEEKLIPPVISALTLPTGYAGEYYSATFSVDSGTGVYPFTWDTTAASVLASLYGLTLSSAGALSGTISETAGTGPAGAWTTTFLVMVTDARGQTATRSFSITVYRKPAISTTSLASGRVGTSYSATLSGTDGRSPYTWSASGIPSGLSMSTAGVISGTPVAASAIGVHSVTIVLSDANSKSTSKTLTLTINVTPLAISTSSLATGTQGSTYSATVSGTGGVTPYRWSASGLPAGLFINSSTGVISGKPTVNGTFTVTITLTDSN